MDLTAIMMGFNQVHTPVFRNIMRDVVGMYLDIHPVHVFLTVSLNMGFLAK